MNALRNFRLQKKKFVPGTFDSDSSSQETSQEVTGVADLSSDMDSPIKPAGGGKRILDDSSPQNGASHQNGILSSELKPAHKRIRILSDSESDCSPVKTNVPSATENEKKISFLKNAYPNMDSVVIEETLKYE